jgi:hypothetical protein
MIFLNNFLFFWNFFIFIDIMKQSKKYVFIRFLFGLYIIWFGIRALYDIKQNATHVQQSIELVEKVFLKNPENENLVKELGLDFLLPYVEPLAQINLETFKNHGNEVVYIQSFAFILGGAMCAFGYSLSSTIMLIGFFLNIFFIHNLFYFTQEKMKVNVLKILALLAGVLHVV